MVMEHVFLFPLLLTLISFISLSLLRHNTSKPKPTIPSKKSLPSPPPPPPPPGTTGWPVIGETLEYLSNLRNGALEKFVDDRRLKYASEIFTTSLIGYPMAILCGAEGNKFLFSNESKLVRIWYPRSLEKIFPKSHDKPINEDFKKVRKILPVFLKGTALQKFVGPIDTIMKQQIQSFQDGEQANVRSVVGRYTLAVACRLFLGIDEPDQKLEQMKEIGAGILTMGINLPWTALNRAVNASKSLCEEIEGIIKQRKIDLMEKRASPTQDVLSHMLLATDDETGQFFNEGDIASYLVGLLRGGFDPTMAALTFIVKYMAELPHVYDGVLIEQVEILKSKEKNELLNWDDIRKMKYSWNVASEVFRLTPPILGAFREATTDFTYAGHMIPKGMKIHWNSHSTHKDPKYFKNPEKFDPSRFEGNTTPPFAFVPFGGGPRMCPGNEYVRLVILVFMHNFVTEFKWEMMITNEKVVFDPHPRPIQGLPIRLHRHKP